MPLVTREEAKRLLFAGRAVTSGLASSIKAALYPFAAGSNAGDSIRRHQLTTYGGKGNSGPVAPCRAHHGLDATRARCEKGV